MSAKLEARIYPYAVSLAARLKTARRAIPFLVHFRWALMDRGSSNFGCLLRLAFHEKAAYQAAAEAFGKTRLGSAKRVLAEPSDQY